MISLLAGGVGGAKIAYGLYHAVKDKEELAIIVNTGDDFEPFGLKVCPDLDTVMYTLAGLVNPDTGWGVAGDTFNNLDMVGRYGSPTWFKLGDRDLATHILRTQMLREGRSLTEVTGSLVKVLGIRAKLLPMCDETVSTVVTTPAGELPFQDYFVRRGASDRVTAIRFHGREKARPTGQVQNAIQNSDLIVFAPSNPILSIQPILSVPGMVEFIQGAKASKIAISPIVAGKAIKGPADRVMADLGTEPSATGVAKMYRPFIDAFVMDEADRALKHQVQALGLRTLVANTIMVTDRDRIRLAQQVLAFGMETG